MSTVFFSPKWYKRSRTFAPKGLKRKNIDITAVTRQHWMCGLQSSWEYKTSCSNLGLAMAVGTTPRSPWCRVRTYQNFNTSSSFCTWSCWCWKRWCDLNSEQCRVFIGQANPKRLSKDWIAQKSFVQLTHCLAHRHTHIFGITIPSRFLCRLMNGNHMRDLCRCLFNVNSDLYIGQQMQTKENRA